MLSHVFFFSFVALLLLSESCPYNILHLNALLCLLLLLLLLWLLALVTPLLLSVSILAACKDGDPGAALPRNLEAAIVWAAVRVPVVVPGPVPVPFLKLGILLAFGLWLPAVSVRPVAGTLLSFVEPLVLGLRAEADLDVAVDGESEGAAPRGTADGAALLRDVLGKAL